MSGSIWERSSTRISLDKSFRAEGVGFRVVAELQALAVEKSDEPQDVEATE